MTGNAITLDPSSTSGYPQFFCPEETEMDLAVELTTMSIKCTCVFETKSGIFIDDILNSMPFIGSVL